MECKVGNIKILTGLDKRMEDINEILQIALKRNQSKVKYTIHEIKNTLDGINSRLQEEES